MDWSNERYCRLYIRDSVTWSLWSWEARALFVFLLRKVDRAGVLDLGTHDPARAIASVVGMPLAVVVEHLPALLESGAIELGATAAVMPNYIEAQEATSSDKQRQSESRGRRRDRARAGADVTESDNRSRSVTDSHAASQSVTPSLAVPNQSNLSRANLTSEPSGPSTQFAHSPKAPVSLKPHLRGEGTRGNPDPPLRASSQASGDVSLVAAEPPAYIPEAYEAASYLFSAIRSHKPDFCAPKKNEGETAYNARVEKKLTGWTKHLDLLIRLDGKATTEVRAVIDFCHRSSDVFERPNVMSGAKLRSRWEQLSTKAQAGPARPGGKRTQQEFAEQLRNLDFDEYNRRIDASLGKSTGQ